MAKAARKVAAAAPVNDGDALFAELAGDANEVKQEDKKKKDNTIPLTVPQDVELLERWAASTVASKVIGEQAKADAAALKTFGIKKFCELWIDSGGRPDSPVFSTSNASGCLQIKAPMSINVPENGNVREQLVEAGLPTKLADTFKVLVQSTTELNVKGLHKLRNGTAEEREAVNALMKAIQENLTPEQRKLVLEAETYESVEPDKVYHAISLHCKRPEQVEAVLAVFSPQIALSSPKHTMALKVTQDRIAEAQEAFDKAQKDKGSGGKPNKK